MKRKTTSTSLQSRLKSASFLVAGSHVTSQVIRLGGNLAMTRLLVPEMFGVMALANTLLIGLALFSDLGIRQSIIQNNRGMDSNFLNTAWSLQILRGSLLMLMVLLLAVTISSMTQVQWFSSDSPYSAPALPYILGILSLSPLIQGFESTKLATANRQLYFKRVIFIEILSQILGLVLMVGWALVNKSIWALVAGSLLSTLMKTFLSHIVLQGQQNKWHWDTEMFHELFHYGKWIFLSTMFSYLGGRGLRLIQGILVTVETLAFLHIAGIFAWGLGALVGRISGNIVFPVFSDAARKGNKELSLVIHKLQAKMLLIIIPCFLFLSLISNGLIEILYDDRYTIVGDYLSIMAINGAVAVLPMFYQDAWLAAGDSRKAFVVSGVAMVLRITGTCVGFFAYGIEGLLYGIGFSTLVLYVFVVYMTREKGWVNLKVDSGAILLILFSYLCN